VKLEASNLVRLAAGVVDSLIRHARDESPAECCGLLIGLGNIVSEALPARNTIRPEDHINARRAARGRGLDVIGFYHSHPRSAPTPSETDIAEASYPDALHAIVSLGGAVPVVEVFRLDGAEGYTRLQLDSQDP
jgi:proteasome lid subunit RPN8/RPN11